MSLPEAPKKFTSAPSRIARAAAIELLSGSVPLYRALADAAVEREKWFGKNVRIHILDNIRNGNCAEDCGYCAQRRNANAGVENYPMKNADAIFADAVAAKASGAYRFCMVTAGTGPSRLTTAKLAQLIGRIHNELKIRVCLSAGFVDDEKAKVLSEAGLDRYNHNLNTSDAHYAEICTSHSYADRKQAIAAVSHACIGVCSGVIVGLGESPTDLIDAAFELKELKVIAIPVNFFIPVPGHAIKTPQLLTPEYCLRVLIAFRLINPDAELRIAAGREGHLRALQATALMVANSLFASGYLNVKGSNMQETLDLIHDAGFVAEYEGAPPPMQNPYSTEAVASLLKHPAKM
ncbi:MAG: biotin synthase BioB [Spirochaetes bacterium]|nr:biotin synthase BioB [Spirochaetota bacterium]